MQAPFFDADAPDYPELLAIAVRAWEHARSSVGGTPKQRVHEYLAQRYEQLPMGTREAIATVVNWRRTGG
jgi:predicted dienelactone hydrolase